MIEQPGADVGDHRRAQTRIPELVPDRYDRGENACGRQHNEDYIERVEVFLPERVVDQVFQAERHDDVEQRLDEQPDADEHKPALVVAHQRPCETIDRDECARGFARGKGDEVLVVVIVVEFDRNRLRNGLGAPCLVGNALVDGDVRVCTIRR